MIDNINGRLFIMCKYVMVQYTCQCVKTSKFVQCEEAKNTNMNIKCRPIKSELEEFVPNYCAGHLVYREAGAGAGAVGSVHQSIISP